MTNYPQELAKVAVCQSHTGHMTGLWFLPTRRLRLNTNEWMNKDNNEVKWSIEKEKKKRKKEENKERETE